MIREPGLITLGRTRDPVVTTNVSSHLTVTVGLDTRPFDRCLGMK
jgi:hypothetical protein